jgi:glycosyltransferase involved in cell wall biosynthesis
MNILFVVPWDQKGGGVHSVVSNLAKFYRSHNHTVIFLHPNKSNIRKKEITKLNFPGYKLRLRPPFFKARPIRSLFAFLAFLPTTLFQIFYILLKHRIQIINIHYPIDGFIYFSLCYWILPIRLVISIHGADFYPAGKAQKKYSNAIKIILLSSDQIVAPSRAFLNKFLAIFPMHLNKSSYIHNGVDFIELERCINEQSDGYGEDFLLSIAMHNEKKGLDVLIKAFALLMNDYPLLDLVLVGDGPLRGSLEQLAGSLNVKERIKFLGSKGRNDVTRLLSACQIFVLPSRSEPFGIVIIEAMSFKKPVIASAVDGITEIIKNGKNGILVEPDNPELLAKAINKILDDQKLRQSIAHNGYYTAINRFSVEKNVMSYSKLFKELIYSR